MRTDQRAVLFDLDGTLTDPRIGITRCIQHALSALGRVAPPESDLLWCIGPPLRESFARLLASEEAGLLDEAMARYRERFSRIGLFENALYPGIPEMLAELRSRGYLIYLATSKPGVFAVRILEHFQLKALFDGIYGSELDGTRAAKGELIGHLLHSEHLDPDRVIMVGDREHDMMGGAACGVHCIGVTYGYGSEAELRHYGAARVVGKPGQVVDAVRTLFLDESKAAEIPAERFAIPGVGGIIRGFRDHEEWILVQERDKAGAPGETGLLEIPAGKIRAFENIYACLRREIKEETGFDVTWIQGESESVSVTINGYDVLSYVPYASSQNLLGEYPIMVQTFLCEVSGDPVERSDESRNIRWLRLSELRVLLREEPARFYPMHLTTLKRYSKERAL